MNNLVVKFKSENGVVVDVSFKDKVNIIDGFSGTGKTYLFYLLTYYFDIEGTAKVKVFDFRDKNASESSIIASALDYDIVIFDNADLYLTSDVIGELINQGKLQIIATRNSDKLDIKEVGFYDVVYSSNSLTVKRYNDGL